MNKTSILKKLRKFHKWPGIVITLFVILFSISGILMNHRGIISSVDIDRKFLPSSYSYSNWNKAAVKSVFHLSPDSALIYGNVGVWLSTDNLNSFQDWNNGFPAGIDNRKISKIIKATDGNLFAGTYFGLYNYSLQKSEWQKIKMPFPEERITDMLLKNDKLIIQTRSFLISTSDGISFTKIDIPSPLKNDGKVSLFRTLWLLHSGELFGVSGKLMVDLFGIVLLIISLTGLLHLVFPGLLRKRRTEQLDNSKIIKVRNSNIKWHNRLGWIFIPFLIFISITGMFLRPPLLITIANSVVSPIPGTILNSMNPWYDKLRRVLYDKQQGIFLFSTSDGMFFTDSNFTEPMRKLVNEPPVSVMGCNVLEQKGETSYIVGSFSGLFLWNPLTGQMNDYLTGNAVNSSDSGGRPTSQNMVDGWFADKYGNEYYSDYNFGIVPVRHKNNVGKMSPEIIKKSPLSLWNLSLEVHTGRIFEPLLGIFYILYVPLAGISFLIVLISGFFIWWLAYRKNKNTKKRIRTK